MTTRIFAACALLGALLVPGTRPVAAAEADHHVQVSAVDPDNPLAPISYTRYYPSVLQVHRGDLVQWDFAGTSLSVAFHSVIFLPGGRDEEHGHIIEPDETPGTFHTNPRFFVGSGCGLGDDEACILDSTEEVVSSGAPLWNGGAGLPGPFRVRIDVPEGTYTYHCTVHPTMAGDVQVVDDATVPDNPTPDEIADEIAADTANAHAVLENLEPPTAEVVDGVRTWTVLPGVSTPDGHAAVLAFLPLNLTVAPGDRVRWVYPPDARAEPHTVTFGPQAKVISNGGQAFPFFPACDPDDRSTGLPGVPGPFLVSPLPCPGNVELIVSPWLADQQRAPGDLVISDLVPHNSGFMPPPGSPDWYARRGAGSDHVFPTSFEATFPVAGTFAYQCMIHEPIMPGSITVA